LSVTVTWKLPLPVLPATSWAVHVTVVAPIGNVKPEAGLHVTARGPSTVSKADAANVTTAPDALVAGTVKFPGTVTAGATVSETTTWKFALPVLFAASVAEHETVVLPMPNVEPEGGVHVTGSGPSTSSVAEAENDTTAPEAEVAWAVTGDDGTVTTGGVVSGGGSWAPAAAARRSASTKAATAVRPPRTCLTARTPR
jgi:hypothetical protein